MQKNQIIFTGVIFFGVIAFLIFYSLYDFNNNSDTDTFSSLIHSEALKQTDTRYVSDVSKEKNPVYILSVPNLNFEVIFPAEPQFHRTDGEDFTRYSWSYIDNSPDGRVALFVQTENNLYNYNSSQEDFIEQTARIYGGVVSFMEKDPDISAINYEIAGIYSNSSSNTETIIGRIIDIGEWTFVVTNQFESENRYPDFVTSFKEI